MYELLFRSPRTYSNILVSVVMTGHPQGGPPTDFRDLEGSFVS
jgi:hypothetical protein